MKRQQGFTLIELMVGMVIGLLTTLVITQVMAVAEGQRRTASSGSSAQVSGAVALYGLQHEMQMAGYGITVNPFALGCPVTARFNSTLNNDFVLAPIIITDGGTDGSPDTIKLLSGSKTGISVPVLVKENHAQADVSYVVQSSFGVTVNDLMVAVPGPTTATSWSTTNSCTAFTATSVVTTVPNSIGNASNAGWNGNQVSITPTAGYAGDGTNLSSYLVNLGTLTSRTFSICTSPTCPSTVLQVSDLSGATGTSPPAPREAYADVVNLQAMYGLDTDGDGDVDQYSITTPTTNAGWLQVMAVRIAVVARSSQREKDPVYDAASPPTWNVQTNTSSSTLTSVTLKFSQLGTDWNYYRYKIYDTVVPLRNVVWNS